MTITPMKPTTIASQRRQPTVSPRNGIERAQRISGIVKPIAEVMVSGRIVSAMKLRTVEPRRQRPRITSSPGLFVTSNAVPRVGRKNAAARMNWPA